MQEMWNKLFTPEVVFWMKKTTGDTEDFDTIGGFIEHMKAKTDYREIVILAMQWNTHDDMRQANLAIHFAGIHHASRFILLMDFLSNKFKEGKLK